MKKFIVLLLLVILSYTFFGITTSAKYITEEMENRVKWFFPVIEKTENWIRLNGKANGINYDICIQLNEDVSYLGFQFEGAMGNRIILSAVDAPEEWLLKDYFENTLSVLEKFLFKAGWSEMITIARKNLSNLFNEKVVGSKSIHYSGGSEKTSILEFQISEQEGRFVITLWEYYLKEGQS